MYVCTYIHVYTHTNIIAINKKTGFVKENKEKFIIGLEERKEKWKLSSQK